MDRRACLNWPMMASEAQFKASSDMENMDCRVVRVGVVGVGVVKMVTQANRFCIFVGLAECETTYRCRYRFQPTYAI